MVVYAAACWNRYYPKPDNVGRVFKDYNSAIDYLYKIKETYGNKYDYYEIFEYEVE